LEIEFPDAFTDERRGFEVVVMNPPWAEVRLYDDDFLANTIPNSEPLVRTMKN
jgi:hypothetical protein